MVAIFLTPLRLSLSSSGLVCLNGQKDSQEGKPGTAGPYCMYNRTLMRKKPVTTLAFRPTRDIPNKLKVRPVAGRHQATVRFWDDDSLWGGVHPAT